MKSLKLFFSVLVLASLGQTCLFAQSSDSLRVSILGDSYSTFEGWLQPSWNAIWYLPEGSAYGSRNNDVKLVEQTWWHILLSDMGYKLEKNNSFSGATICFTGYKDKYGKFRDYSDRSFVTRASDLGNPDLILVCGCTNDSWCGAPVGEYKWKKWTNEDLFYFRPAMAKMCSELKTLYPSAKVIFILNSELREDINESVHTVCRHYHIDCVDLYDIDKQSGHPSQAGMKAIAAQVKAHL